jgi:hypothetical protein
MLLTCLQVSPQGGPVRLLEIAGHQHGDRLVHHFRNRVAEDPFCGIVDEEDGALLIDGDDGIRSRLGDHTEELGGVGEPFDGID